MATNECPVSVSRGWVFETLTLWASSRRFEGAQLCGENLFEWPANLYDAFEVFQIEFDRIAEARQMADNPTPSE